MKCIENFLSNPLKYCSLKPLRSFKKPNPSVPVPVIAEDAAAVHVRGELLAPQPGLGLLVALPQLARAEHEKRIALKRRLFLEVMLEHVTCHNMFSGDFYVHRELLNDPEFIQFNKRFAMNQNEF